MPPDKLAGFVALVLHKQTPRAPHFRLLPTLFTGVYDTSYRCLPQGKKVTVRIPGNLPRHNVFGVVNEREK